MDSTKEQRNYISLVVPSNTEWLRKKKCKQMKDIIEISIAYWRDHLRWETWNNTRNISFLVKVDF